MQMHQQRARGAGSGHPPPTSPAGRGDRASAVRSRKRALSGIDSIEI